jgi:L-alanine-DL-glutamate epimerase-like enolase superfamily enzyme
MTRCQITRRDLLALGPAAGLATLPARAVGASERIRITKVDLRQVVVPMQPDIINSPEFGPDALTEFPSLPKLVVKVYTDSGIVGIGETSRALQPSAVHRNAAALTGKNVLDLNLANLDLPDKSSYSGFEMALYDIVGKAFHWPVYRLLGGLAQSKVLVNYWCGRNNPVDIRRVAQRAVSGRFQGIKIKGRPGDPVVKAVAAVAEVAPHLKITVDFNAHHKTVAEFLPIGRGLDAVGNMLVIEDPINKDNLAGYRELRQQLKTPIALHLGAPKAMMEAIRAGACSI